MPNTLAIRRTQASIANTTNVFYLNSYATCIAAHAVRQHDPARVNLYDQAVNPEEAARILDIPTFKADCLFSSHSAKDPYSREEAIARLESLIPEEERELALV